MKRLALVILLTLALASAEAQSTVGNAAKGAGGSASDCVPIGQTAKGELVYSMKCQTLPAPPAPPPQAEVKEAVPPPEPEAQRTGLFGWSFDRRKQGD